MKREQQFAGGLALLVVLLFAGTALAQTSANFNAVWSRFASGGEKRHSANYIIEDILGQWVSANPTSANHQIVTDFYWPGDMQDAMTLYLPLVTRSP